MVHRSGLIADNPMADYDDGPETAWERICSLNLVTPVGTAFKYSDVNFIVLGKIVEKLAGWDSMSFPKKTSLRHLEWMKLATDQMRSCDRGLHLPKNGTMRGYRARYMTLGRTH